MGLNDPTAMGALAALQAAKRDRGVLIYGVDGATVAQSPMNIGKTAGETVYRIIRKETVQPLILIPVFLIDKSNVDQYGVDGWQ
jgi:ribose transport system substrate-binding protein